jgi:hypothetical protein
MTRCQVATCCTNTPLSGRNMLHQHNTVRSQHVAPTHHCQVATCCTNTLHIWLQFYEYQSYLTATSYSNSCLRKIVIQVTELHCCGVLGPVIAVELLPHKRYIWQTFDTHTWYLLRSGNGALAQILDPRMSVNVTQAEGITSAVYLSTGYLFLHSHDLFILNKSTSNKCVCVCVFWGRGTLRVICYLEWPRGNAIAMTRHTWRVYPSTDVCHINQVCK